MLSVLEIAFLLIAKRSSPSRCGCLSPWRILSTHYAELSFLKLHFQVVFQTTKAVGLDCSDPNKTAPWNLYLFYSMCICECLHIHVYHMCLVQENRRGVKSGLGVTGDCQSSPV